MNRKTLTYFFATALVVVVCYFPIFLNLEQLVIRDWDESRIALTAMEMEQNGNYIVPYVEGQPEMWSVKPPLLVWMQVICIKFFGWRELSFRLPSAIAAFILCLGLVYFSYKVLRSYFIGLFAVAVLVTSHGYINVHAVRTGDYDSMLTLFSTFTCLFFFMYVEKIKDEKKNWWLSLFWICITLGVFTKSITIFLFSPPLLMYVTARKQLRRLLSEKVFYINFLISIFLVAGYYFLREQYTPGFLKAVVNNELGGRYLNTIEGHEHDFWFYFNNFKNFQFKKWLWLLPAGFLIGITLRDNLRRNFCIYASLLIVCFFFIVSYGQTKLEWYDLPMYPFMALLVAVAIEWMFHAVKNTFTENNLKFSKIFPYIILILLFYDPYSTIIKKVYKQPEYEWDYARTRVIYFLRNLSKQPGNNETYYVCHDGYTAPLTFYMRIMNKKKYHASLADYKELPANSLAIAHQDLIKQYIEEHYQVEKEDNYENVIVYKILNKKTTVTL